MKTRRPASLAIALFLALAVGKSHATIKTYRHIWNEECPSCTTVLGGWAATCSSNCVLFNDMVLFNPMGWGCMSMDYMGVYITDAVPGSQATVQWSFNGNTAFRNVMMFALGDPAPYCSVESNGFRMLTLGYGRLLVGGFWAFGIAGGACYCWPGESGCRAPANLSWTIKVDYQKIGEPQCSNCKDNVKQLKQGDPEWATQYIDSSTKTIGKKGCLLTSFAMITGTDPISENVKLTSVKALKKTGDLVILDAAAWSGYSYESLSATVSDEVIMDLLCLGNHIIAEVQSSAISDESHFVVVTGATYDPAKAKCRVDINDPATNNPKQYLDQYPAVKSYRRLKKNAT